jgi:hypothetical protein
VPLWRRSPVNNIATNRFQDGWCFSVISEAELNLYCSRDEVIPLQAFFVDRLSSPRRCRTTQEF